MWRGRKLREEPEVIVLPMRLAVRTSAYIFIPLIKRMKRNNPSVDKC